MERLGRLESPAINLGRNTDDTKKSVPGGSSRHDAGFYGLSEGMVDGAAGKFEVGTGFLPKPEDASEGGVIVGGASLWIMNNRPAEEQKAAWEFIKYLATPEVQAIWHINTGYISRSRRKRTTSRSSWTIWRPIPQFKTAVDQLHATKLNPATQGAVMGVFPEARQIVEGAIEEVLNSIKSPQEALDGAQKEITSKIEQYNRTVK